MRNALENHTEMIFNYTVRQGIKPRGEITGSVSLRARRRFTRCLSSREYRRNSLIPLSRRKLFNLPTLLQTLLSRNERVTQVLHRRFEILKTDRFYSILSRKVRKDDSWTKIYWECSWLWMRDRSWGVRSEGRDPFGWMVRRGFTRKLVLHYGPYLTAGFYRVC